MTSDEILLGAETVAHLSVYFDELRGQAVELKQQVQARTRGYFTPSEDERTRQLLISYWQSRLALYELVTSFRDDASLPAELRPAAFLVAYGGAVLLVHAARFLRETFGNHPVVRAKLNEPEPHFGIPADTFDCVQRSLTSPRTAWHLYHAIKYFQSHEPELRALAASGPLAPVMAVIDEHAGRLQIDGGRLAAARLRIRTQQAATGLRRDLLGSALYGLQKLGGTISSHLSVRPGHSPSVPSAIRHELASMLIPGDVLITRKEFAVTNYFLPGYWPHAALYLGSRDDLARLGLSDHENVQPRWHRLLSASGNAPEAPGQVLEALKDGVRIRSLGSPLGSDSIVALRPQLAAGEVAQALARGLFHEGKPYDFDFDFSRSDRLVCTEVVYRSYEGIGGMRFELLRRAGRLTLAAEDLLAMALARNGFDLLAIYAPSHCKRLCTAHEAETILRATRGEALPV
jgi:hypothetical protein